MYGSDAELRMIPHPDERAGGRKNRRVEKGGRLEVEVELSWVPPQVRAQGYQAPVGVVASLGVTMVM